MFPTVFVDNDNNIAKYFKVDRPLNKQIVKKVRVARLNISFAELSMNQNRIDSIISKTLTMLPTLFTTTKVS